MIGPGLAVGALGISSNAGYGGVGPNFLPWLIALSLLVCGRFIVWGARSGGTRSTDEPTGSAQAYRPAHLGAGVLDVHAIVGDQSARPYFDRVALSQIFMNIFNQLLQGFAMAATPINLLWCFVACALYIPTSNTTAILRGASRITASSPARNSLPIHRRWCGP